MNRSSLLLKKRNYSFFCTRKGKNISPLLGIWLGFLNSFILTAFLGHVLAHKPHPQHILVSIDRLPFFIVIPPKLHFSTHNKSSQFAHLSLSKTAMYRLFTEAAFEEI